MEVGRRRKKMAIVLQCKGKEQTASSNTQQNDLCCTLHFTTGMQLPNLWYIKLNSHSLTPAGSHYYFQMFIEILLVCASATQIKSHAVLMKSENMYRRRFYCVEKWYCFFSSFCNLPTFNFWNALTWWCTTDFVRQNVIYAFLNQNDEHKFSANKKSEKNKKSLCT